MLAHPDGARIIAASQRSLKMAAVSELAMSTLVGRGIALRQARLTVLTVLRFTVGYVLEEQVGRPDADATDDFDMAAYATAYPTVTAAVTEYFRPGLTVDDLFRDCLNQIVPGPAARSGAPGTAHR